MNESDILFRRIDESDYGWLYYILANRPEHVNISHTTLPSYSDHCAYWDNKRNQWEVYMAVTPDERVGYYYVTCAGEIGIFVDPKYQQHGVGTAMLAHIIETHPVTRLLANVAPRNAASKHLFRSNGFRKVQETYELRR